MKTFGLTGGVASGKSTASNYLIDKGYIVIDADKSAHQVMAPGGKAYHAVVEAFGKTILNDDYTINRTVLGDIVFNDKDQRERLNRIVHPAVREDMNEQRDEYLKYNHVFMDIPLLFENGLDREVDETITVYVNEEIQLNRLMKRNDLTREQANARIHSQMPLSEKCKRSDWVWKNNQSRQELYIQIDQFLSNI